MGSFEKVAARRQRKLDRGELLPEALDMFPGNASFDNDVQAHRLVERDCYTLCFANIQIVEVTNLEVIL